MSLILDSQAIVQARAKFYQQIHEFFAAQQATEVQDFALEAVTDEALINYFSTHPISENQTTTIYQIVKVCRDVVPDRKHAREFAMLVWYRQYASLQQLMDDVQNLLGTITGQDVEFENLSYQDAFLRRLEIDPVIADIKSLKDAARRLGLNVALGEDKQAWLDLLFKQFIEPTLGINQPVFLTQGAHNTTKAQLYIDGFKIASIGTGVKLGLDRLLMLLLNIWRIDRVQIE